LLAEIYKEGCDHRMKDHLVTDGNKLSLKVELSDGETFKYSKRKGTLSLNVFKKPIWVTGYSSMCKDGSHILLLDYDNVSNFIVEEDALCLIQNYCLPPFYIFKTSVRKVKEYDVGNYHAICLLKMSAYDVVSMQRETNCDKAFATMPLRNIFRSWVLRTSLKNGKKSPEYLSIVPSKYLDDQISGAHLKLLKKIYNIPDVPYRNMDNYNVVYKNVYETGNY